MNIKREFVPKSDEGRFIIRLEPPTGSTVRYTDEKIRRVEGLVLSVPETESVFVALGIGERKEVNKGFVVVTLKDRKERKLSQQEIMGEMRKRLKEFVGFKAYVEDISPMATGGRRVAE